MFESNGEYEYSFEFLKVNHQLWIIPPKKNHFFKPPVEKLEHTLQGILSLEFTNVFLQNRRCELLL